ncbi:MAG: flagellar hook-basal body complex protein FliE [Pyrinomonadaceae bacterium]
MSINAVNGFTAPFVRPAATPTGGAETSGAGATGTNTSFGSSVKGALEALDQQQKGAEQEIARAVTGESPDLHRTIVAMQTADLNFQFALQVRNKLVGAYEEIMRMQV